MKPINYTCLFLVIVIQSMFVACRTDSNREIKRPREAWIVRSVLDKKPRMLSIALNENLWIAYNTQTSSLYKAWNGNVNFDGPVYTNAHGPQPNTKGITYTKESDDNPWLVVVNGEEIVPQVNYKGHLIENNQVILKYELTYKGKSIKVEEKPEFFSVDKGAGLERIFTTHNVQENASVILKMSLGSLASETDYETDGKFEIANKSEEVFEGNKFITLTGRLTLNNNEATNLKANFISKPASSEQAKALLEGEAAVFELMAKSDCNTCHNKDVKTVGPAYVDIAKKYENTEQQRKSLAKKIVSGGAGNWGTVPMTPHPDLTGDNVNTIVSYIMSLDAEAPKNDADNVVPMIPKPSFSTALQSVDVKKVKSGSEQPGIAFSLYHFDEAVDDFPVITGEMIPVNSGFVNALHLENADFGEPKNNLVLHATGFINITNTINVVLRLVSDDGSKLLIDEKLVIDNGGTHGSVPKDAELILKPGKHPFRVEYFQGGGGSSLSLQWHPHGSEKFEVIPPNVFSYKTSSIKKIIPSPVVAVKVMTTPGDASLLTSVHPSFDLSQARPKDFKPRVGGMDFLSDGRMVVSTWDSLGSVFILDNLNDKDPEKIKVKRIAFGLAEPLGLKVVDDEIYVLQKQELTKLIDHNKDDIIDEYQTVCNGWKVSANFHEFAFGLLYKDGFFYGTLATAINPGGASTKPQIQDRGKAIKISKADGSFEFVATGLRTPNGIGFGVDNEIYIADNQGDWLPSSKILHLQTDAWYGSRSVDFEGTATLTETPPVVWLPQDEVGNSPSQPAPLNVGLYKNQMIHGEVTNGGIKRVFAEKVNGAYQGAVFHFTQGLEAGVNRLTWGTDNELYVGGIGSTGNWAHAGKLTYGLQKLTFNNKVTFEMLAIRAKSNGVEIEFTEPLKEGAGTKPSDYSILQWWYKPTADYGGPKIDLENLMIKNISISPDRKKVFLQLTGMKPKHVIYIRLNQNTITSSTNHTLWVTESWYTMNSIPTAQ